MKKAAKEIDFGANTPGRMEKRRAKAMAPRSKGALVYEGAKIMFPKRTARLEKRVTTTGKRAFRGAASYVGGMFKKKTIGKGKKKGKK